MNDLHAYEVLGDVLLRYSGQHGPIEPCKIIRTRVINMGDRMGIALIVGGYDEFKASEWFEDWSEEDYMKPEDMQSGRPVDVAVRVESFNSMLATGRPVSDSVRAIRLGNRWVTAVAVNPADDAMILRR